MEKQRRFTHTQNNIKPNPYLWGGSGGCQASALKTKDKPAMHLCSRRVRVRTATILRSPSCYLSRTRSTTQPGPNARTSPKQGTFSTAQGHVKKRGKIQGGERIGVTTTTGPPAVAKLSAQPNKLLQVHQAYL